MDGTIDSKDFAHPVNTASVTTWLTRRAGGLYESVRRLHQSLFELQGVRVQVLGLEDEFIPDDLPAWAPVSTHTFPWLGFRAFGYSPSLSRRLLQSDVDVIHVHGLWQFPSVAALRWYKKFHRPYLISPHGMLDPWAVRNSAWKKRIARLVYEDRHLKRAACIRALCESEALSIRKLGLRNPICVVPNGIDLPSPSGALPPPPFSQAKAARQKILLSLGRIHPKKGMVNLLHAWRQARDSGAKGADGWTLVIAGWDQGGHEDQLKRLAAELGIYSAHSPGNEAGKAGDHAEKGGKSSVLFVGPQFGCARASCYANCDAFILPSFSEGLPMVVLEAWAYSKPVLITPECNVPEGFTAQAAVRIETNAANISEGLMRFFLLDESARAGMGENGRRLVVARFAWPRIAADLKRVYDWVLGRGARPDCLVPDSWALDAS